MCAVHTVSSTPRTRLPSPLAWYSVSLCRGLSDVSVFLQGLKMRRQRSTGDIQTGRPSGSIRSTGSSASWMSTDSGQSAYTTGDVHDEGSNASFIIEVGLVRVASRRRCSRPPSLQLPWQPVAPHNRRQHQLDVRSWRGELGG